MTASWFLIGLVLLAVFRLRGHEGWLLRASETAAIDEAHDRLLTDSPNQDD